MGSLEQLKLKKLVEDSNPSEKDSSANEYIFSFKNDQEAESSNPSDKFSYLGQIAPITSDPSSFNMPNLPLTPIEEDA